jgi:hypothetical protein
MEKFEDIIKDRILVIPKNQRGFSWTPKQAKSVFDDLELAGKQSHYLGPVIVSKDSNWLIDDRSNTVQKYILEDGQQRITTYFLIVSALHKLFAEGEGVDSVNAAELDKTIRYKKNEVKHYRLKNANADLESFLTRLLDGDNPVPVSPPMSCLQKTHDFVVRKVSGFEGEELLQWRNRILNASKFIWVDLKEAQVNRYLTFDAINSRGLPLSEFDKIKNFCILLCEKRNLDGLEPDEKWYKSICALEEYSVANRSSEETFMTEYYATFHNVTNVSKDQVHELFVSKYGSLLTSSDENLENDLRSYITGWTSYASSFGFITARMDVRRRYYDPGANGRCTKIAGGYLDCLDNLDLTAITRKVLTAAHWKMSGTDFEKIAKLCEIFTFRVYAIPGWRIDKHKNEINSLASQFLRQGITLVSVERIFCSWLAELAPISEMLTYIANGEGKYPYAADSKGWGYCYYFLYEYEISCSPAGVGRFAWGQNKSEKINTIEHVLPQGHRDGGWWDAHWGSSDLADEYMHRIGNLTLTNGNSQLGRKPFPEKLEGAEGYFYSSAGATNSEKLIHTFTDVSKEWQSANITKREEAMLKFASERWSVRCCEDNGVHMVSLGGGITTRVVISNQDCISPDSDTEAVSTDDLLQQMILD